MMLSKGLSSLVKARGEEGKKGRVGEVPLIQIDAKPITPAV